MLNGSWLRTKFRHDNRGNTEGSRIAGGWGGAWLGATCSMSRKSGGGRHEAGLYWTRTAGQRAQPQRQHGRRAALGSQTWSPPFRGNIGRVRGSIGPVRGNIGTTRGNIGPVRGSFGTTWGSFGTTRGSFGTTWGSSKNELEGPENKSEGSKNELEGPENKSEGSKNELEGPENEF